ncbi:MAG: glutamate synthase large subunit [Candidatus Obscuribacterales bacterium]|nr:glutamate synthase large subunit [Candidatus Obscuribacterales bacterium]
MIDVEHDACGVGFIYRPDASHTVIDDALMALANVEHRGASGHDGISGDGAGVMFAIPWQFFAKTAGWKIESSTAMQALGVVFIPKSKLAVSQRLIEDTATNLGLEVCAWREVPINRQVLGESALSTCPEVYQFQVVPRSVIGSAQFDSQLIYLRKCILRESLANSELVNLCIVSLSAHTVVYKALTKGAQLREFYDDLNDRMVESKWAVFHRRFCTNTMPRWALAQPFSSIGHNGEINSLLGNRNWLKVREADLPQELLPLFDHTASDSSNLNDALEMYIQNGYHIDEAIMVLMPEPYKEHPLAHRNPEIATFYKYHAAYQEPWDGPALIVYSDGLKLGAAMDRNGLRPCRFAVMKDGGVFLCSEMGALELEENLILRRGRLGPGQMLSIDLPSGRVSFNAEIKSLTADRQPYSEWLARTRKELDVRIGVADPELSDERLQALQKAMGYSREDLEFYIGEMSELGHEPIFSMGDDTPLAVLSSQPRPLFDYFKQRFAQVTNPPIDHLRERVVMSLDVYLGDRKPLAYDESPVRKILHLDSPIIDSAQMAAIVDHENFPSVKIDMTFVKDSETLEAAVKRCCADVALAVRYGATVVVLSDRGVCEDKVAIPVLLAVGAIHHHLIRERLRLSCGLVVESGQVWNPHQYACLLGYGAQCVFPYLAYASAKQALEQRQKLADLPVEPGKTSRKILENLEKLKTLTADSVIENYRHAVNEGILKILSKMGISALTSYIGAQVFEAIGIGPAVIEKCFAGTVSRIGGMEIEEIEAETLLFHNRGFAENARAIAKSGMLQFQPDGESHGNNPAVVRALHKALDLKRSGVGEEERHSSFEQYFELVDQRKPISIRDLFELKSDRQPIKISEVEPASEIVKRFCTGAMSLGSLSREAHETVAVAMNRLGGKSNSGEGGEDPLRFYPISDIAADGTSALYPGLKNLKSGDSASSAIRQVASARFGVTPEYLVTAQQLEIKMAQGSKPGEGGQLPGHKVTEYIAKLRRSKQGVPLISPPPHHDIYSIEDLAQLIYDLHQINRDAKVSVKLVSQIGIGTVATGVAKANADVIQVSGFDGGTGASPLSSIKNAGLPWELGLAEVHQALLQNHLRQRVLLRVDGGLRSGKDVIVAALLGAEEYGFGSIALIAAGCIMARICHTNNCPVGITSQKEQLRARFDGSAEHVVEFFSFLAYEVREVLASLGYKSLGEIIGRGHLLTKKEGSNCVAKGASVDLNFLAKGEYEPFYERLPHINGQTLDDQILQNTFVRTAIDRQKFIHVTYPICNRDRAVGARISGEIAKQFGDHGFAGQLNISFKGSAGQSFGAFNIQNLNLVLEGEANDYVGKGMNGGEIVIRPARSSKLQSADNVILGNTCLYGATGGALYAAGQAGERFAVRNSRAVAVIEGAGDHCCEYMTGGTVVVLGSVGRNFGAGMTGGIAYVLDECDNFASLLNHDGDKKLMRVPDSAMGELKQLVFKHQIRTKSAHAQAILDDWERYAPLFWQVVPVGEQIEEKMQKDAAEVLETGAVDETRVGSLDSFDLKF